MNNKQNNSLKGLNETKFKFSIKLKLLIIIISGLVFTTTTIAVFFVIRTKTELVKELEKRGRAETINLAFDAQYGVLTENTTSLNHLIAGRMKKSDIAYVTILSDDGTILASNNNEKYQLHGKQITSAHIGSGNLSMSSFISKNGEIFYEFTSPIITETLIGNENEKYITEDIYLFAKSKYETLRRERGIVKVGLSLRSINKKIMDTISVCALIIFVVTGVTIAISNYFITIIVKPIRKVADVAGEIAMGNFAKRVDVKSTSDEIGIMASNFNKMTAKLNNTINELKQLKTNLERKIDERTGDLQSANIKLEKANNELKALNSMKDDFIFAVSHDFRTPLTSIIGYSKTMQDSIQNEILDKMGDLGLDVETNKRFKTEMDETQEGLEIIAIEGERLARLINALLDMATLESGNVEWKDTCISLRDLVDFAFHSVSFLISEKDLKVHIQSSDDIPGLFCDRDRIMQVVVNLLSNAIKYSNHGGTISCDLKCNGRYVEFKITDTGIGIAESDLNYIFTKFKRVETTVSNKLKGTGLGLSICKEILAHYGGEIWAESELGKGSVFAFTLPIKTDK